MPEYPDIYAEITSGLVPIYSDDKLMKALWRDDVRFNHLALDRTGSKKFSGHASDMPVRLRLAGATNIQEAQVARLGAWGLAHKRLREGRG